MAAGAFSFPVRVYYEDTDAAGVVYYANYLRYLERARTEWLAALGHPIVGPAALLELPRASRIVFVVRRLTIDYRAPARLADALDVTVAIRTLRHASLVVAQEVRRDKLTLVDALVDLACVDSASFAPTRIPHSLTTALSGDRH